MLLRWRRFGVFEVVVKGERAQVFGADVAGRSD